MFARLSLFTKLQSSVGTRQTRDIHPLWEKKWNESGFRRPLCTYRLNWARRTSWGWWDDWDDTVLQTQDSKFEPWRSEAEHATSRSRRLPTILTFTCGWGRNNFVSFKPPRPGTEPRTLAWKAAVLTTTLGPPPHPLWECVVEGGRHWYNNGLMTCVCWDITQILGFCLVATAVHKDRNCLLEIPAWLCDIFLKNLKAVRRGS